MCMKIKNTSSAIMLVSITLVSLLTLLLYNTSFAEDKELFIKAYNERVRLGYDIGFTSEGFNVCTTIASCVVPMRSNDVQYKELIKKSAHRNLVVFYGRSKDPSNSGLVYEILDKDTREIIGHYGINAGLTRDEAIVIALKKCRDLGYKVTTKDAEASKYDESFNKYLPETFNPEFAVRIRGNLEGHIYWAVYCHLKQTNKGWDAYFFIDNKTGAIIDSYINKNIVTKTEAETIAEGVLKKRGMHLNKYNTESARFREPLNDYYAINRPDENYAGIFNRIKDREYWVVYYYPQNPSTLGDICVFVDLITGKFIGDIVSKVTINKYQAINIAQREAIRLSYNVKKMNVEAFRNTTRWEKSNFISHYKAEVYSEKNGKFVPDDKEWYYELIKKFQGHEYWAVRFYYDSPLLGGSRTVIIDAKSGKILASIDL
jgi:Peptidase propeptide and YPEB domain